MKKLLLFSLMAIFLMSCGKFHDDGTSVWQAGLWIIPVITIIGSIIFGWLTYKSATSGSNTYDSRGAKTGIDGGDVPFYKIGWFYFSAGLFIATIVIVIMVNSDK